ncbi:MAG: vWA domain-containing protein, partial [Acidobacteriota bacterium]
MRLPAGTPPTIFVALRTAYGTAAARSALLLFALFTVSLVFPVNVSAQHPDITDDDVVRVNTELLLFPVRLRVKRGQTEAVIKTSDLVLKDNDHVITGLYFARGADRLALVFALDQSGSLRDIISQQREAALDLFSRFSERSRVAVIHFSDSPELALPFGRDTSAAREAFEFPAAHNRSTAIFDAAAAAV